MPEPPDPDLHSLGTHIRRLREQRGLSLEALADASGISRRGLTYLEHGRRDPRYTTLLSVATGLNVHITDLLTTDGTPNITDNT